MGASSRLRCYQYESALRDAGMSVDWHPLFYDAYLRELYSNGRRGAGGVLSSYFKRFLTLLQTRSHDLIWVEQEAFPWMPALLDTGLLRLGPPYVVDLDDAIFHRYDNSSSWLVRKILGRKIDIILRHAALVVAGNPYLARRAQVAGASRVEIVPTVVDLKRYDPKVQTQGRKFTVGWIGNPSTQSMVQQLAPVLKQVLDPETDRFVTVGARVEKPFLACHQDRPWTEETEVREIQDFDVGIMPLKDRPFERGKCGYKLIQYMACGLPVVASPVGVNVDIVQQGVNGFLANSDEEWMRALSTLKASAELRSRMGSAGRATVERKYCLQVTAPRLASLLLDASG